MDLDALRADVPALSRCTYLNWGASGAPPRQVVDAATDFLERHAYDAHVDRGPYEAAAAADAAARETIAGHLGTAPANVAFGTSTAAAINLVAGAIDWNPGDVVVRTDLEHPAGRLPWDRLADLRDVEVRVVPTEGGRLDVDAVAAAVADARLVVLSSLTWTHGTRLPVEDVVDVAHDAGALVLVDAVQSLGQHPVEVEDWGADFVAGAGHKWLLGVWGAGVLYVRPEAHAALDPRRIGYRSVEDPADDDYAFREGARRFDVGTTSPAPHVAMAAAIETIEAVGYDAIEARVDRLTDRLRAGLGDRVLTPPDARSGLVSFRADDPDGTVEVLAAEDVVVRSLPRPKTVRASVHGLNTAADVDELLAALPPS
jgi:selenocysteine lyase/cysteine desulfurase